MEEALAHASGAGDALMDALAAARPGWLVLAVALHVSGQVLRGLAWHAVLTAAWPGVARRRVCAWHVAGAGLTGVLSARGGDAIRLGLARKSIPDATLPALAATLVIEGSVESLFGVALAAQAVAAGAHATGPPSALTVGALALAALAFFVAARRWALARRVAASAGTGLSCLRDRRRYLTTVLPLQLGGRLVRLASLACFLLAFGLPCSLAVIAAATVTQGSARMLPVPGAGTAAAAAALLVVLPAAAHGPVDHGAVTAFAVAQPAVLTLVGVTLSTALLAAALGTRSPRLLLRHVAAIRVRPTTADAPAAAPAASPT